MSSPEVPQTKPFVIKVEPGTYAWCACGRSENQPYCDGKHKGSEFKPVIEKITETQNVAWCGCKHSASAPFCDGSHKNL